MLERADDATFGVGDTGPAIVNRCETFHPLQLCCIALSIALLVVEKALDRGTDIVCTKAIGRIGVKVAVDEAGPYGVSKRVHAPGNPSQRVWVAGKRSGAIRCLLQTPQALLKSHLVVRDGAATMWCDAQSLSKRWIGREKYPVLRGMDIEMPGI